MFKTYIGLDMSLTGTGIAIINGDKITLETISTVPKDFDSIYKRVKHIASSVEFYIPQESKICIEAPFMHSQNPTGAMNLIGLAFKMRETLEEKGHFWHEVATTQLKKFVIGKGRGEKGQVMMHVRDKWSIMPADDNQADALVLAKIAQALDRAHDKPLTQYQTDVLNAIVGIKKKTKNKVKK